MHIMIDNVFNNPSNKAINKKDSILFPELSMIGNVLLYVIIFNQRQIIFLKILLKN